MRVSSEDVTDRELIREMAEGMLVPLGYAGSLERQNLMFFLSITFLKSAGAASRDLSRQELFFDTCTGKSCLWKEIHGFEVQWKLTNATTHGTVFNWS